MIEYMHNYTAPPDSISESFRNDVFMHIPYELRKAVQNIDSRCYHDINTDDTLAWKPAGESLWAFVKYEEDKGNINKGMKVLELGSGSGSSTLIWSYLGYPVTGIELNSQLVKKSEKLLSKYSSLQNAPMKIIEGSYYPKEFVEYMRNGMDALVKEVERLQLVGWSRTEVMDTFYPICPKDVYSKNNISIKDFDIIYAYLWQYQFPSVLDMFNKYARDDALFLAIGPNHDIVAKQLGLKTTLRSNIIRK